MPQRTGVRRKTRQPLSVDLLPMDALEAVKRLRAKWGLGWMEIERLSSLPFNKTWETDLGKYGFIDWDALPARVVKCFPDRRVPHSNLHRWYDIRVQQAKEDVLARAAQAREIAEAFSKAGIDNADDAVLNAARDIIFGLLQENIDQPVRIKASAGLIALAEVMQSARANAIRERAVSVDERKIAQLEKDAELKRKRVEQETENAAKKLRKGGDLTIEDINRLRERTFGLPPVAKK